MESKRILYIRGTIQPLETLFLSYNGEGHVRSLVFTNNPNLEISVKYDSVLDSCIDFKVKDIIPPKDMVRFNEIIKIDIDREAMILILDSSFTRHFKVGLRNSSDKDMDIFAEADIFKNKEKYDRINIRTIMNVREGEILRNQYSTGNLLYIILSSENISGSDILHQYGDCSIKIEQDNLVERQKILEVFSVDNDHLYASFIENFWSNLQTISLDPLTGKGTISIKFVIFYIENIKNEREQLVTSLTL